MIKTKKIMQETEVIEYVECDNCRKKIYPNSDDPTEWQEMIHINHDCGYGSIFGDGNTISINLCQECVETIFGEIIRTIEQIKEKEEENA